MSEFDPNREVALVMNTNFSTSNTNARRSDSGPGGRGLQPLSRARIVARFRVGRHVSALRTRWSVLDGELGRRIRRVRTMSYPNEA